ncbi:tRNA/tmRNA/rRNA uracil-C5-methylase (TrmA/RlmC/RlmD family) [Kibdelosporangium banguiense]|uniref:tRNA/tmRNA/rRNA uracil-C5-methylase (TrmA/RlmC/RlmD family) n=1 Tax=Kibdelosporangium banguiense TaxID=1365924 RepID=A0ABS4U2K7_9PSEU|nr:TRAM domain-containing protein [Kibdelosporangium banguiense]MBP2330885.1 tRNA/tmRNA/rRNA uracil-C5-methylase (TrmA/RlmC/RlmD family) [Kibdelosporangium banguiense]
MTTKAKLDWRGRRLDVEVGPVAHGGHCVARYEGRVVFVRHALPGERVIVQVTEDKGGSFCRGDAVEIITASPDRVEPPCPLAAPGSCGGCDWQHASGEAQRQLKASVVAEHLAKATGTDVPVVVEELTGGLLEWRTRIRMAVDRDGIPGFRAHRSHTVVPVGHCPITVPGLVESVAGQEFKPGSELEMVRDGAGRINVRQVSKPSPGYGRRRSPITRAYLTGDGSASEFAAGRHWDFDAYNFWQIHPAAADTLAGVVAEWAEASPGACAWDLYSGVGLFASVLAEQVGSSGLVWAVEYIQAASDATRMLSDLTQVKVLALPVEGALERDKLEGPDPEVVVLDPPRTGAGHEVVDQIAARRPARVIYVACDPAALGRDVARFLQHGYRLELVRAFDAFPMTHHVEAVALLTPGA